MVMAMMHSVTHTHVHTAIITTKTPIRTKKQINTHPHSIDPTITSPNTITTMTTSALMSPDALDPPPLSVADARRRNPAKIGRLVKVGQRHKSWRRRLFILIGSKLYYYRGMNNKNWAGVLEMRHARVTRADDECRKRFAIKIETQRRTLHAHADSEEEINQWIVALIHAAEGCLTVRKDHGHSGGDDNGGGEEKAVVAEDNNVFSTIQEAIDFADNGERILVWPGVYEETLVIEKPVHIEGVWQSSGSSGSTVTKQSADAGSTSNAQMCSPILSPTSSMDLVFDLDEYDSDEGSDLEEEEEDKGEEKETRDRREEHNQDTPLEQRPATIGSDSHVVIVSHDDCCIAYKAKGAKLVNIELRVTVSEDATIGDHPISALEMENGQITLENCTFTSNAGCGILAMNRSICHINRCLVVDNRDIGVWFWDKARGEIHDSAVKGSGWDGLRLTAESQCIVRNTAIEDCMLHGVVACDKTKCLLESSRITSCAAAGVRLSQECNITMRNNVISSCGEFGLHCTDMVCGHVESSNKFVDNSHTAVLCEPDDETIRRTMTLDIDPTTA